MSWPLPPAELPDEVDELLRERGAAQVNLYRALANSPELVVAWTHFIWTLRDVPTAPRSLRELVILRTAVRHASAYEWQHHVTMARRAGVTEDQIAHVHDFEVGCFGYLERAALEVTDAVCDCVMPDEIAARAVALLGVRSYVEVCLTAAAYSMVPRVLQALGVSLEPEVTGARVPRPSQR